jgi:hypothetical protein
MSPQKPIVATVLACVAALVAAFLPWLRTGDARRSAYALARSADALGVIDSPLRRALLVSWYLLPLVVAAAWTAGALGRPAMTAVFGGLAGSMSAAAGSIVIVWTEPEVGSIAAIAAGGAALACALWLASAVARGRTSVDRIEEGSAP